GRRRHTRFDCDWSSDVCSSDLPIAGATSATYAPVPADEGAQLVVQVTGTAPGGEVDTATSARTAAVQGAAPQSTGPPVVSGVARDRKSVGRERGSSAGGAVSGE